MPLPSRPVGAPPVPVVPQHDGDSGAPQVVASGHPHPTQSGQVAAPSEGPAAPAALLDQPTAVAPAPLVHAPSLANSYQAVGAISSEALLYGRPDQMDHLQEHIITIRDWLQQQLANEGLAERVSEARTNAETREEVRVELDRLLLKYMSKETVTRGPDRVTIVAAVINEVIGLGPIEPLWGDPRITEVMVNGPDQIYVEIEGKIQRATGVKFRDRKHLMDVCQQILIPLNRRVDQKSPLADGRLPDGSRVNIVHPVLAPTGPLMTIRRFPETVWTLKDYIENGSLTAEMACELGFLVYHRCSIVVCGGTGSGKTSALNALSSCIPRDERVVTVEDSLELRFHPEAHVAALEARPRPIGGDSAEIRLRDLIRNALRMRPDRIVVGEVRDHAALDMLQAMNTGHEGSLTTVHANGAEEVLARLGVLVAMGGEIPEHKVAWLVADAVDLFVVPSRYEDGSRRIQGVYEMPKSQGKTVDELKPIPLWVWEQTDIVDGRYVGEYRKVNDLSPELIARRRLNMFPKFTVEDIYKMSEMPQVAPPGTGSHGVGVGA